MKRESIRLRSSESQEEKEEAFQAWLKEPLTGTRFLPVGQGPLVIDTKTMVVYDAVEFLMRQEDRKGAKTRDTA